MSRYHEMSEYNCPADYYDAGNLGSVPPSEIRRQRADEQRERDEEQEHVSRKTWGMGCNE